MVVILYLNKRYILSANLLYTLAKKNSSRVLRVEIQSASLLN